MGLAIALNVSMGAPGQIVGVWIYTADEVEKGYPTGHWTMVGRIAVSSPVVYLSSINYGEMLMKRRGKGERGSNVNRVNGLKHNADATCKLRCNCLGLISEKVVSITVYDVNIRLIYEHTTGTETCKLNYWRMS